MIIIVEGIDRVGKTTFIDKMYNKMENAIRLKDSNVCSKKYSDDDFSSFSLGKLDTSVAFLKQLSEQCNDIIVDRLHLTEIVYGLVERNKACVTEINQLDEKLSELNCILVYVQPTNLEWSNIQAEKDQSRHLETFKQAFVNSSIEKYYTNFNDLDETVEIIMNRAEAINAQLANGIIFATEHCGKQVNGTTELINENTTYFDITTREIVNTFNINKQLTDNFFVDVKNKNMNTYGPYIIEKYSDLFDKMDEAMQYLLTDNIHTRRCIIQFDAEHCFQNIQFVIRENKLHILCNMRSCNAIVNYKADIFICSVLGDEFRHKYINMYNSALAQTQNITMNIGSLHIFNEKEEILYADESEY